MESMHASIYASVNTAKIVRYLDTKGAHDSSGDLAIQ